MTRNVCMCWTLGHCTESYTRMTNDELAAAIDYARGKCGTQDGSQRLFVQHLERLLAIQEKRAGVVYLPESTGQSEQRR